LKSCVIEKLAAELRCEYFLEKETRQQGPTVNVGALRGLRPLVLDTKVPPRASSPKKYPLILRYRWPTGACVPVVWLFCRQCRRENRPRGRCNRL
jgi:hypothetical protein